MITRPPLETVIAYRNHVDRAMASLMQDDLAPAVAELVAGVVESVAVF